MEQSETKRGREDEDEGCACPGGTEGFQPPAAETRGAEGAKER